jgi:hypothetical protein
LPVPADYALATTRTVSNCSSISSPTDGKRTAMQADHQPHRPPYGLRGCRHIPRARPAPRHPLDPAAPQGSPAPALSSGQAECSLPPVLPLRMCYPLDSSKRCCEPRSPSWRSSPDPSRTAGSARLSAASATTRHPRNSTNYVRGSRNSMVSAQRFGVGSSARLDRTTPATPSKAKYLVGSGGSTDSSRSSRRSACAAVKGTARSSSRCYCSAATPSQSSGPGPLSGPRSCLDRSKCRAMDVPTTVRNLAAMVASCEITSRRRC